MAIFSMPKILNSIFLGWQNVKDVFSESYSLLHVKILFALNVVLNCTVWYLAYHVNSIASQDLVYLHYNVDFGVNFIGSVKWFYVMPGLGSLMIILNTLALAFFQKEGKFVSYLLLLAALVSNGFLLLASGLLYLINFR